MTTGSLGRALVLSTGLALLGFGAASVTAVQQPETAAEAPTARHPWIGQPAPAVDLVTTSGETVSLGDYRGNKFVVLHFAASW